MEKIRLTKNEQKKQKDNLRRFERYLPTLMLKKLQLQIEIRAVEARMDELLWQKNEINEGFAEWIDVFIDEGVFTPEILKITKVATSEGNIAGVAIPVFEGAWFEIAEYDLHGTPLWLDHAVATMKKELTFDLELRVLGEQQRLLLKELLTTSQRVNLFEKVKIPATKANIKKIAIYLGDQQTAAVVRGKIAKRGMEN